MINKELVIIGAGPAGITAAVYAARKKMDFSVISREIGGQADWSGKIENYTGYQYISGPELAGKFREHLATFKFDLREGQAVTGISKEGQGFKVTVNDRDVLLARTVIVATGKRPRPLDVPGEEKFRNKGLTYCAICDGPLFAGKDVAVIGGGNSALDAALQMIKFASKVYLVNHNPELTGDAVMAEKVRSDPKVEILNSTKTIGFFGEQFLGRMKVQVGDQAREIAVEGVFVEIGLIPNSGLIDFVDKNEANEIIVNCAAETSCPGVFAAGDVTNVIDKQIIIAAGEGAKAALSAARYLSTKRE